MTGGRSKQHVNKVGSVLNTYVSTDDPAFRSTIADWLAQSGELAIHLRFNRGGGVCSFELLSSLPSFAARLGELRPRTFVSVFRDPQLPQRGRVDEAFIAAALASLPKGTEYLVAGLELTTAGSHSWFPYFAGTVPGDLRSDLEVCFGELAGVGPFPDWTLGPDRVISAIVPDEDGSIHHGIY